MTVAPRAALLLLLLLVGTAAPAPGFAQDTPDEPPSTEEASTADESLHALQLENDSLRAALGEQSTAGRARTTRKDASMALRFLGALAVFALIYLADRGAGHAMEALHGRRPRHFLFFKRLLLTLRLLLWAWAAYFILRGIFDIAGEGLLIAVAIAGLAIGVAAQDLLKNLLGGLVLAFAPPFQVGDRITVGDTHGEVTAIGSYATRITTPEDTLVSVPNAQLLDEQVAHTYAGGQGRQVVTDLYLPAQVDEANAKRIAYEAAASSTYAFLEKPIAVHVRDVFNGTVRTHLQVKAYVLDASHAPRLVTDVTERARHAFREEGLLPPVEAPVDHRKPRTGLTHPIPVEENGPAPSSRPSVPSHSAGTSE